MRCERGVASPGPGPAPGAGGGGGGSGSGSGSGGGGGGRTSEGGRVGGSMASRRRLSVAAALTLVLLTPLLLILDDQPLQLLPWRRRSATEAEAETMAVAEMPVALAAKPAATAIRNATEARSHNRTSPATATLGRDKGVSVFEGEPSLGEQHIFFVETSCALDAKPSPVPYDSESGLRLSPRAACALESAAAAHPSHHVYLVHTCDVRRRALAKGGAPAYALAALSAPNVRLWAVPYARHYVGTPLRAWLASGALRTSLWPVVHASDIVRFLLLWKYGGTYLDLDVLTLRSFGKEKNFGCAESTVDVSVGAFNFALDEPGRRVANACVEELLHYRHDLWSYNGPGAITRALKKVCNVQEISEMTEKECGGFHLLPTSTFYAIPWQNWSLFFTEESSEETMKKIGENLAVHVWNALSHDTTVNTSSKQPYAQIARRVCPNVVAVVGDSM